MPAAGTAVCKAIVIHQTGDPGVLSYEDVPVSAPGPRDVLIEHHAIGVNYIDTYHRSGLYKLAKMPAVLGQEAAGVVIEVGTAVTELERGALVAYATAGPGSYAERRVVPADKVVRVPEGVSAQQAAAVLLKGMTAEYLACRTVSVERGQTALVHAAAGGVGSILCRWLAHRGAQVIGIVGSDDKVAQAREHGCAHVIVRAHEDFVARTREITQGRGVHVVYDSVGKDTVTAGLDCLQRRGMLVAFGNASGPPPAIDPLWLGQKGSLFLTRPTLFDYVATPDELRASAAAVFERVRSGVIPSDSRHQFALSDAAECHRALEARATTGPVLLLP
jgi:NADPH2:quinone reductase